MPTSLISRRPAGRRRRFGFGRLFVFLTLMLIARSAGWVQLNAIRVAQGLL